MAEPTVEPSMEPIAQTAEEFRSNQNEIITAFIKHLEQAPEASSNREHHRFEGIFPSEDTNVEQALSNLQSLNRDMSISDFISSFRDYSSRTLQREENMLVRLSRIEPVATELEEDDFV